MHISFDKKYYKELFKLALPLALASLLSFSLSLSDNLMVSRLGDGAASSVYLGNQVFTVLQFIIMGIESTTLVLSSRTLGEGNNQKANRIFTIGTGSALIISGFFFAVSFLAPEFVIRILTDKDTFVKEGAEYLKISSVSYIPFSLSMILSARAKSEKHVKIPFFSASCAVVLNISLNFLLIFGNFSFPKLGIQGAAVSTLIARIAELAVLIFAVLIFKGKNKGGIKGIFKNPSSELRSFFSFGSPIILSQAVWCINNFFAAAIMGRQESGAALAAASAAMSLYNLAFVFAGGLSAALGVLTARELGANEGEKIKGRLVSVQLLFISIGILTGLFMQALKLPFLTLWGIGDEAKKLAAIFINILSVFIIGTVYQSALLNGLIKSGGNSRFVFLTEALAVFLFIIPPSLILDKLSAAPCLIFAALKCDQILKCPIAYFALKRMKWEN